MVWVDASRREWVDWIEWVSQVIKEGGGSWLVWVGIVSVSVGDNAGAELDKAGRGRVDVPGG